MRKIKRYFLLALGIVSPSEAWGGLYSEKEINYIRRIMTRQNKIHRSIVEFEKAHKIYRRGWQKIRDWLRGRVREK